MLESSGMFGFLGGTAVVAWIALVLILALVLVVAVGRGERLPTQAAGYGYRTVSLDEAIRRAQTGAWDVVVTLHEPVQDVAWIIEHEVVERANESDGYLDSDLVSKGLVVEAGVGSVRALCGRLGVQIKEYHFQTWFEDDFL